MGAVAPNRRMTREEETRYEAAVSEAVAQKLAGSANFINLRQFDVKIFSLFGPFSRVSTPQLGAGGVYIFPFDAEIFNIAAYIADAGSASTTEVDVKLSQDQGATWASIFSTTPKAAHTATANAFALAYDITEDLDNSPYQVWTPAAQPTGFTGAVLNGGAPYSVNAGDGIKLDLITSATAANNFQLIVYHRPR